MDWVRIYREAKQGKGEDRFGVNQIEKTAGRGRLKIVSVVGVVAMFVLVLKLLVFSTSSGARNEVLMHLVRESFISGFKGGVEISSFSKDADDPELRFFFYKVKVRDTLTGISKKLGVDLGTLISLNSLKDAHTLFPGQKLLVPNVRGVLYTVRKGDTIEKIARRYKITVDSIIDANELTSKKLTAGQKLFLRGAKLPLRELARALGVLFYKPLRGRFTSGFGLRRDPFTGRLAFHTGIDIARPWGTPVKAAKSGVVVFAGWKGGYGRCIIIRHSLGYTTRYGHLSRIYVRVGQRVKTGQVIGAVGSTGRSTGPHLHFEVRRYGRPLNPLRIQGLRKGRGRWY